MVFYCGWYPSTSKGKALGVKKKYELHGGTILILDLERSPFRYHQSSRIEEPTVELFFLRGTVNQEVASKAVHRVAQTAVVVTGTRIQVKTRSAVKTWSDAMALCDTFVEELDKLLRNRDRTVASQRAAKAGSRSGYRNDRPTAR